MVGEMVQRLRMSKTFRGKNGKCYTWSQAYLAKQAGVDVRVVKNIEEGGDFKISQLMKIEKVLGVMFWVK